jgi:acetyltransferase-like isoleucine patch superfamily enzyme
VLGQIGELIRRISRRLRMVALRPLFGAHGQGFYFDPDGTYTYGTIHVGDDVNLGVRPVLMAALSEIRIGSHVMFGPEVVVIGGGHNISVPGQFMTLTHEKTGDEDLGVVIADDVWVGARAVILRGVEIGRGAVIGAGALVTKSVPPYAIVAGNPARVIRYRWDVETILSHESKLHPPDQRYSREALDRIQAQAGMMAPRRTRHA